MKRLVTGATLLMGMICLSGCASMFPIETEMSSWKGAQIEELTAQVGPPTYVRDIGLVKTYAWEEDNGGTYSYGGEIRLLCTRTVGVDGMERVVSWSWTGTGCNASPAGRWLRKTSP